MEWKWNTKKCSVYPKESRKGETEGKRKDGARRKQKVKW